jgi:DNA-3-methyladenine glycosylase
MRPLPLSFYLQPVLVAGRQLLGKYLISQTHPPLRIVETEAYPVGDVASHAFRGKTLANAAMFGPPGTAYVHINYGIHHCINAVIGEIDTPEAILIRAVELIAPTKPIDSSKEPIVTLRQKFAGPGRLCKTLGIHKSLHNTMLLTSTKSFVYITEGDDISESAVTQTTRIGLSKGVDSPWRWYITESKMVSRR